MSGAGYSIGIDFGTESGRAVLVNVDDGREVAAAVYQYSNGVIDRQLPNDGPELPPEWALQDPADYIRTVHKTIPELLTSAGVKAEQIIGIGIDFTSCTMLPATGDGTPLCLLPGFRNRPHAWVKLWKHHAAQPEADKLNAVAAEREEAFLDHYGGKISSEWFFPKVWQMLNEDPEVYEAADRFIEGADWIVWQLTGVETRNSCTAGYKAIYNKETGFPSENFFAALDPRLERVVDQKMSRAIIPLGRKAGGLTAEMAEATGLHPGTAVAVGNVDAHVSVPAAGVAEPGRMVMIMGTSICHMVIDRRLRIVPGMCGVVADGIMPDIYGYEAGQSAVGDIFAWYVNNGVPAFYQSEADRRRIDLHQLLEEKAARLRPGQSGLLALDWWNGNRSILVNADLSGLLIGMTLATKPEDVYRALIESTAFGTKVIIDAFEAQEIKIEELVACGGLPQRNHLLMQIYADVSGRVIKVTESAQTPALGAAMFGAVAAGKANGGYDSISEAAGKMGRIKDEFYRPDPDAQRIYQRLYKEYETLHDYFGRYRNPVMKTLRELKNQSIQGDETG
ncbi:ribulokinase [candidate division KSB1 bacterium]